MERITKEFPGVQAVRDVSISVAAGEVLAVVGENGAGKSTLMRIAAGVYPTHSYSGSVRLAGDQLLLRSVSDGERAGISLVSQELQVVPEMSVAENIFLNREPWVFLQNKQMLTQAAALMSEFDASINPATPVRHLGVGQRQMVMLARARLHRAQVVIFDEPTASLSAHEVSAFYAMVRRLTAAGTGCVFVSHRIDEVFAISDRIAVMRNGELIGIRRASETRSREIVSLMLGRDATEIYRRSATRPGSVVLELKGLRLRSRRDPDRSVVSDVSLQVHAGEILGLFGLVGAGRTELASAVMGVWRGERSGSIEVAGHARAIGSARDAIKHGVAWLTEDRRRLGLFPNMDVQDNINLGSLGTVSRWQVVDNRLAMARTADLGQRLHIRAPSWSVPAANLSGGNQQKVLLARLLAMKPVVLLLDEPTRGIDVGAKEEIFSILNDLTSQGVGIVLISSELKEVMAMSDRVVVLYKGTVSARFDKRPFDDHLLLEAATGGHVVSATARIQ